MTQTEQNEYQKKVPSRYSHSMPAGTITPNILVGATWELIFYPEHNVLAQSSTKE
jgi:hypothetical protein